jgi:hypothetical protein
VVDIELLAANHLVAIFTRSVPEFGFR